MHALQTLLTRTRFAELEAEGRGRKLAEAIFTEWRDRYIASLCGYMRTYDEAARLGVKLPKPYRNREWCNAAVAVLTIAEPEVQDYFLRADEAVKDRIVAAVLSDGGVTRMDGFFSELPV